MRSGRRHQKVDIPASKLKAGDRPHLQRRGLHHQLQVSRRWYEEVHRLYLKYTPTNEPAIANIERVSRPGCRVYFGSGEIPRVLGGLGINILTTPNGVMTGRAARKEGVGGELWFQVW